MARKPKAKVEDPVGDALREKASAVDPPLEVFTVFAKRKIPESYVFDLMGINNAGLVLHSGISPKNWTKVFLGGHSVKHPDLLEVGESTETVIDGLRFKLVRTA